MSEWTDQIDSHEIHDSLRSIPTAIESILTNMPDLDSSAVEKLERIKHVVLEAQARISLSDPDLLSFQALNKLSGPIVNISNDLANFQSDKQLAHINNAHNRVDNVIIHLSSLLTIKSVDDVDSIRESITSLRRSMGQNLRQHESQSSVLGTILNKLKSDLSILESNLVKNQQRVDISLNEIMHKSSLEEESRKSSFDKFLSRCDKEFDSQLEDKGSNLRDFLAKTQENHVNLINSSEEEFKSLYNNIEQQANTVISNISSKLTEAQKLVGIISNTGMVGGFQKEANQAENIASTWRGVAAWSLILLIAFSMFAFFWRPNPQDITNWADFGWRAFVATSFALLAAFAALQSDKYYKATRRYRKMELELAAISPYLKDLPDDTQYTLRVELAHKLFAQTELIQSKDDRKTTGSLVDVIRMAIETIESMASK
jgi:hypothetical protein